MQAVKITFIILLICASCVRRGLLDKASIGGNYVLETYKAKSGNTIVAGEFFNHESKLEGIPAFMNINGVIQLTDSGRFNFNVLPGVYKIQGGFISKKWIVAKNINVERGDSVFLKLYLIDDDRPLYEK